MTCGKSSNFSCLISSEEDAADCGCVLLWSKRKTRGHHIAALFASRQLQPLFRYFSVLCSSNYSDLLSAVFYCRPITAPKQKQQHFTCRRSTFENFCLRIREVFPHHTLLFRAWLVIVGSCFITCDISLQQILSFFAEFRQETLRYP
jgi:hypothetical protein